MGYLEEKKKAMMNKVESGGLPSAYQQVEWVGTQGGGGSYIVLGQDVNLPANDVFQIGVELNGGTGEQAFWGTLSGTTYAEAYFKSNKFIAESRITSSQSGTAIQPLTKYDFEWYSNNTLIGSHLLFAYRTNKYHFNGKIYYFKWLRGNDVLLDMLPCYRKSDNEIGMYDLINDEFYTNNGNVQFLKGADV